MLKRRKAKDSTIDAARPAMEVENLNVAAFSNFPNAPCIACAPAPSAMCAAVVPAAASDKASTNPMNVKSSPSPTK